MSKNSENQLSRDCRVSFGDSIIDNEAVQVRRKPTSVFKIACRSSRLIISQVRPSQVAFSP
jgi:hypothetical protein